MGDGINDAPALHVADVGISVDSAVDIAKAAAAVILLEKDLMVLQAGVIEGRKVFVNILKYVRMGASSNFGNMFSVIGASAFLPFVPMAPIQVLTNNLDRQERFGRNPHTMRRKATFTPVAASLQHENGDCWPEYEAGRRQKKDRAARRVRIRFLSGSPLPPYQAPLLPVALGASPT